MGPIRSIAAVACSALLLTAAAATAQTTQDRATIVTFSGPVSIPGKTLPAGTYTFKLADSPADRHIVQIFDKEQTNILATILAVPADRTEAEGDPVITFKETPADRPPAVRYWYYAGERAGNEFVYPKSQAMMIARASGESVMSVDTESTDVEEWKKGTPSRVTAEMAQGAQPAGATSTTGTATTASTTSTTTSDTTAARPTQPAAAQPTTTPDQPQPTAPPPPPATAPTTTPDQPQATAPMTAQPTTAPSAPAADRPVGTSGRADTELPHTASEIPAIGLIGVFALAGALLLRVARRAAM